MKDTTEVNKPKSSESNPPKESMVDIIGTFLAPSPQDDISNFKDPLKP